MGHGFREVIVDQPFSGKWTGMDMNMTGGHGTFQGTKFSDSAGGFSYRNTGQSHPPIQNRFIYWRILNDMLELTESSINFNLEDNQFRIVFPDSPIVGPISIQETETQVVILVTTVTSVNRFAFVHPTKGENGKSPVGNKLPSIFQQASLRPAVMKFLSKSLFENTINIPVPTTASCCIMPHNSGFIYAIAYESGGVTICKLSKDDSITCYDLRQSNLFSKILSFTPSILRSTAPAPSSDAAVGLYFFTAKIIHERKDLFLAVLSMNGHLRLYCCGNLETIDSWTLVHDVNVDGRFAMGGYIDSSMLLRKYQDQPKDYPTLAVFMPGVGFKLFQCLRDTRTGPAKLILNEGTYISFREKSLIDFCITSKFLFTLVNNPDEDTDWEVKSYDLHEYHAPRFNLTLLETPPRPEVYTEATEGEAEPKEFYMDLIFNKCSFSVSTIYSALSMFKNSINFPKPENDWELAKLYALRVIDSEICAFTADTDEAPLDEEIRELSLKYWGEFYTSCVEYHVNTVKPSGVFFERNTNMLCIIKKSRFSFLRPTDFLETAFYFPHLISPENSAPIPTNQLRSFQKYLEILELLESNLEEFHIAKINKRLFEEKQPGSMTVWSEVANLMVEADPRAEGLERRHFISMVTAKLREFSAEEEGSWAMKQIIEMLAMWDVRQHRDPSQATSSDMDTDQTQTPNLGRVGVGQHFMGSRLGANVAYQIVKQLLNIRYVIGRNMLLLQAILNQFICQAQEEGETSSAMSYYDHKLAKQTVFRYFSVLELCNRHGEFVYENWSENSRKVAALLNCPSSDQLIHGKIPEFWPIKLLELFSYSSSGGLAIRSRVSMETESTPVVAYADALGRTLWISEDSPDRPFEEFLISAGQYSALSSFATQLKFYDRSDREKAFLNGLYKGVGDLFLRDPLKALSRFMAIAPLDLEKVPYICKLLGIQGKPQVYTNAFYEKAICLFQVLGSIYGIQRLTQKALRLCRDDRSVRIMSVLGFKSALALGDYESAFQFILAMPKESPGTDGHGNQMKGKERQASISHFVIRLLEKRDVDVLVGLKIDDFGDPTRMRSEIEKVLQAQAKLSDPVAEDSVYQMVYFYYLTRNNFEKAAAVLLERIRAVGARGKGRLGLEIQRDCYLDILMCLTLMKAEEESDNKITTTGSGDSLDVEDYWLVALKNIKITNQEVFSPEDQEIRENIQDFEKMARECQLCVALLLLNDKGIGPVKTELKREKAKWCIQHLIQVHHYDQAVKLATMWNISYLPIVCALAQTCTLLVNDMDGDIGEVDYIRHLDISDLPTSNYLSAGDIAFFVLKKYVTTLEKSRETKLHHEATLVLLRHCVSVPRWLLDSYKKRDANQLILCFMRFGDWSEATDIAMEVLDVSLGRRDPRDFDPSIQVVSPYVTTPIIPYTTIEDLANQMNANLDQDPKLNEVVEALREKCDQFVVRVLETRVDRRLMFGH